MLESPHAGALFKICDPKIASALAMLSMPRQIKELRRQDDFPGPELLALLLDCGILFKADAGSNGLRIEEGDRDLVFWDFHDLLFHTRSTEGRHANPLGGVYPYAGVLPPLPAVRPSWSGKKIDLTKAQTAPRKTLSPLAKLLRERISTRMFDNANPITIAELSQFLDGAARVLSVSMTSPDLDDGGHAMRPYPSAGAAYELELYLAAVKCDGLARGFYHYDASTHALVPIEVQKHDLDALLAGSQYSMGAPALPQILITIAARFARMSWKYSSIAYSLILKDVGVLDSDALSHGGRYGSRRLRTRDRQYRSLRKDDGDRLPRRRPGRSICTRPRGAAFGAGPRGRRKMMLHTSQRRCFE